MTKPVARQMIARLAEYDILFVEQPIAPHDPRALAELFPEGLPRQIVALRTLDELIASASDILDGRIRGRIVVDIAHS